MSIPLLLESHDLQKLLASPASSQLLIIDLSSTESYQQGHIANAVHVAPKDIMSGESPGVGRLPSSKKLSELFSHLGLSPSTHVICYDDEGGGWAGRFIWTLDMIGHSNYSYLNGGILAWRAAGAPESTAIPEIKTTDVHIQLNEQHRVHVDEVMANLYNTDFIVWDARSPAEYSGEKILAAKGGHIPGAINCEWTSLMQHNDSYRIRDDAETILKKVGIDKSKYIVTHCQSHHRSGFTYLLAKILGFPHIKAYDGSWSEWGNLSNTPVEL